MRLGWFFISVLFHFELSSARRVVLPFDCKSVNDAFYISTDFHALKEGFHRDLELRVEIDANPSVFPEIFSNVSKFELLVKLELPPSTYVDPYQQQLSEKTPSTNILLPINVDVEASSNEAKSIALYTFCELHFSPSRLQLVTTISLPIHVRYHPPQRRDEFVSVHIPHPHVSVTNDGISTNSSRCESCRLRTLQNSSDVILRVPAGQSWHLKFVSFATCSITFSSCLYLCFIIGAKRAAKVDNS